MIPERVADDLLSWLTGTRLTPIMVVHANHPAEIDDSVAAALGRCVDAGIPTLNQAVLLRSVNDDAGVLAELCERLVDLRVMPYYLHQLDRVSGAAHFEVPMERGLQIIGELRKRLPGYAVPRYVQEIAGEPHKVELIIKSPMSTSLCHRRHRLHRNALGARIGSPRTGRACARAPRKPEPPPGFPANERPDFNHPNVRLVRGDITDVESLRRGMAGCSQVYHLAGYAKNWARDPQTYIDINVGGLQNVCEVAIDLGIERVVWTSTMLTFGPTRPGEVGDEAMPRITPRIFTQYESSKIVAEQEAAQYVRRGLPIVIVNPGRVFGPGHFSEGNALSLLIDMYDRGQAPILLNRGRDIGNYVYVDDVVEGLILAMQQGRPGEKYLLGGENLSLKQFFALVDKVSGKRHFQFTIRRPGALSYAWLQKKRAEWFGVYPQITPDWVRVFLTDWAYTSAKAERELGYRITPIEEAVRRTYQWLLRVRAERKNERM